MSNNLLFCLYVALLVSEAKNIALRDATVALLPVCTECCGRFEQVQDRAATPQPPPVTCAYLIIIAIFLFNIINIIAIDDDRLIGGGFP